MGVYTKRGDGGETDLLTGYRVLKTDSHIEVLGNIDELTSNIGVVRSQLNDEELANELLTIQMKLKELMSVIASDFKENIELDSFIEDLENSIDKYQLLFPKLDHFIYPGDLRIAAHLDVARTVTRRAERRLAALLSEIHKTSIISKYINRLSDYLFVTARMLEFREQVLGSLDLETVRLLGFKDKNVTKIQSVSDQVFAKADDAFDNENPANVYKEPVMTLKEAKAIASRVEEEADRIGVQVVISVATKDGLQILTHIMDHAFIVSKGLANKKAYTSAALKMPTHELKELTKAGTPLEGLEAMVDEDVITLGGGYPIQLNGLVYGSIGVSGSTVENDIYLAAFGAKAVERKEI